MNFIVNGKDFKSLIDRISAVVAKKSTLLSLQSVKISAGGDSIKVSATNAIDFASIEFPALIVEQGETWVMLSDLKKIAGIDGDIVIKSECDKFEVRGAKKSYEIPCHYFRETWIETPIVSKMSLSVHDESEFLKLLSGLDSARSDNQAQALMTAFYIDRKCRCIVTIDGYRIGIGSLYGDYDSDDSITADGSLYPCLKSLIGKNKANFKKIKVYSDHKYSAFVGEDYSLVVRNVDGIFFDYHKITDGLRNGSDYSYTFDTKQMESIAKEYNKLSHDTYPMVYYNNGGRIATGILVDDYRTSDAIENTESEYGMSNEWYVGINPRFIVDACKALGDKAEMRGNYNYKNPLMLRDDTYEFLILPININTDNVEFVKKQVA